MPGKSTPKRDTRADWPAPPERIHSQDDTETVAKCVADTCEVGHDHARHRVHAKVMRLVWQGWCKQRQEEIWEHTSKQMPHGLTVHGMQEWYDRSHFYTKRSAYSRIWLRRQLRLLGYGETHPNGQVWLLGLRPRVYDWSGGGAIDTAPPQQTEPDPWADVFPDPENP